MSLKVKSLSLFFTIIAVVLIADQVSKRWILDNMLLGEVREPIPALSDNFRIVSSQNTGIAFGLGQGAGDIFLLIPIAITLGMMIYFPQIPLEAWLTRVAFGMVVGGAIGNVIDRLEYGYVVDFINYRIPDLISNVSNIADHAIVIGVFFILVDTWRMERRENLAIEASNEVESVAVPSVLNDNHSSDV